MTTRRNQHDFKVSLRPIRNVPVNSNNPTALRSVTFDVTPDLVENRNVDYKTMNPVHMPGSIYVYGGTASRTFQLSNVRLISRTIPEADYTMNVLHLLRSWTMPWFGDSAPENINDQRKRNEQEDFAASAQAAANRTVARAANLGGVPTSEPPQKPPIVKDMLGAPPEVLHLNAYAKETNTGTQGLRRQFATNIHRVPVVIQNLSIPYPSDVDYVPTSAGEPIPIIMSIDIQLVETQSPSDFRRFRLQDFREGRMIGF